MAAGVADTARFPADVSGPEELRRAVEPIAASHGATIPQVALARSPLMLPATASITHLRQNLAVQELTLTPEQIKIINELAADDGDSTCHDA